MHLSSRLVSQRVVCSPLLLLLSQLAERKDLSNSMGLFLQKTNIIRDYLEDYVDGRAFWPQEVSKCMAHTSIHSV